MSGRLLACGVIALSAMLGGCASTPHTTVVLLPDEDGHVGAVTVMGGGSLQRIDQAFNAVTVRDLASKPSDAKPGERATVERNFGALLKAQPTKPLSFTLYFVLDSVALTETSRSLVAGMIQAAKARKPTEVTVYGHADASGSERRNEQLSEARAKVIADLLRASDPELTRIEVLHFGDRSPRVPNEGRNPEPRNRRAEVVIL